jgi:hypothetical protein
VPLPGEVFALERVPPSPEPNARVISNGHPHLEEQPEVTIMLGRRNQVRRDGRRIGGVHDRLDSAVLDLPVAANLPLPAGEAVAVEHASWTLAGWVGERTRIGPRPRPACRPAAATPRRRRWCHGEGVAPPLGLLLPAVGGGGGADATTRQRGGRHRPRSCGSTRRSATESLPEGERHRGCLLGCETCSPSSHPAAPLAGRRPPRVPGHVGGHVGCQVT